MKFFCVYQNVVRKNFIVVMNAVSKRVDCKQQFLLGILQYLQVIVVFDKRGS